MCHHAAATIKLQCGSEYGLYDNTSIIYYQMNRLGPSNEQPIC